MNYDFIRQSDPDIYYIMEDELERQRDHVELIASENFTSEAVMEAMGSHLTNKYAEGYPGARFYGGCENVDHIEKIAIRRAKTLYKAEYANVQPHAGSQANVAVYAALLQPGDTIIETTYAANKLTFKSHSANGGLAVFSEVYFPWGWHATIDGKEAPIGRVNYVLRAMQLPAGDHTIEMTYDPQEVHQTETVATTAILAIFIILLLAANLALFGHLRKKS